MATFFSCFGQLAELLGGVFELGDVLAAFLDLGGLVGQLLAGLLQSVERLVLLGDRFGGLLGVEVLGGFLHRLGRLVEGLLHLVLVRQRRVLDFVGLLGEIVLLVRQLRQLEILRLADGLLGVVLRLSSVP